MPRMITPKFLTAEMAKTAIEATLNCLYEGKLKDALQPHRKQLYVVVLVPGMMDDRPDYPAWPNYDLRPVALYEYTLGDPEEFPYPFNDIAKCKALQLWHDRNDDRTEIIPHLLFPGDTPFWGGVKRRGIVVSCSGVKPWLDKMISGMVADMLVAMAHAAWEKSADKADDELCFLT
ncbi:MAG TPA: hypothetical protein VMT99_01130 [Candidatus Paceibacterota bacterium]|nr:hypothetical protein [Candidatus Paceibacterota bacterium]